MGLFYVFIIESNMTQIILNTNLNLYYENT